MTVVLREEPILMAQKFHLPRTVLTVLVLGIFLGVAGVSIVTSFLYFHVHRGAGLTLARLVPFPAAVVDGSLVWYRDVALTAVALEDEAGLAGEEAIDRALLLEVRERIMERLAHDLGVPIVDDKLAFSTALETALLASTTYQSDARGRLERLVLKLNQGLPFTDVATQYSEGPAASLGGDLGYIDPTTLPEDLRTTAAHMAIDEVSDIVTTTDSFWVCKANDVLMREDGTQSVSLQVIEIKKDLLGEIVDRELARATVKEFLR